MKKKATAKQKTAVSSTTSKRMAAVRAKDSDIELLLRKRLWNKGYRFRKNYRKLPGTADIAIVSKKIAVFCDSDFWHGYDWKNRQNDIKSNRAFWLKKIEDNKARDIRVNDQLRKLGWKVLRFWGHEILRQTDQCISSIEKQINAVS